MSKRKAPVYFLVFLVLLWTRVGFADRQIAITIDDLPVGGDGSSRTLPSVLALNEKLLRPFREDGIPVIGFVNERRDVEFGTEGLADVLNVWLNSGAELGNHSASHLDINNVSLNEFTADIQLGERTLNTLLADRGRKIEYFRHPFLRTGASPEKKAGLQSFLDDRGYIVAPVTLDNHDYLYARAYLNPNYRQRVAVEYLEYMASVLAYFEAKSTDIFGREIPQILLLHANQLNADVMPDLLDLLRRRKYRFVSVAEALEDEAYRLRDTYVGRRGISWLHRWSEDGSNAVEQEPPMRPWLTEALRQ